jgi:transcriptional regulator with XRE-family HTH domain
LLNCQIQPQSGAVRAFGRALREIRETKEISQEQLALDSGLDRTYISLIERGINSPSIRVVVRIAAILKVPPSKIVRRMEQLMNEQDREPLAKGTECFSWASVLKPGVSLHRLVGQLLLKQAPAAIQVAQQRVVLGVQSFA